MNMVIAVLCMVGGIGIIWVGAVVSVASFTSLKSVLCKMVGVYVGFCIILIGLFIEFYFGWWGIIRVIIDYTKQ